MKLGGSTRGAEPLALARLEVNDSEPMPCFCMTDAARTVAGRMGLWLCLAGTLISAENPGAPPGSFIQDDARLFDAATMEELSRTLAEGWRATGVPVYVAASSFLEGGNMREHSNMLVARWLTGRPGLLIAYNRGNALPAIASSPEFWQRYPADEVAQMFADAGRLLAMDQVPPEWRVRGAAELAVGRTRRMEENRRMGQHLFTRADARLAVVVAATLAVAGSAIWLVVCLRRRRHATEGGSFLFPDVAVVPRLGAPFGGGAVGGSNAPHDE